MAPAALATGSDLFSTISHPPPLAESHVQHAGLFAPCVPIAVLMIPSVKWQKPTVGRGWLMREGRGIQRRDVRIRTVLARVVGKNRTAMYENNVHDGGIAGNPQPIRRWIGPSHQRASIEGNHSSHPASTAINDSVAPPRQPARAIALSIRTCDEPAAGNTEKLSQAIAPSEFAINRRWRCSPSIRGTNDHDAPSRSRMPSTFWSCRSLS